MLFDVKDARTMGVVVAPGHGAVDAVTWLGDRWLLLRGSGSGAPYAVTPARQGAAVLPITIRPAKWQTRSIEASSGATLAYVSAGRLHLLHVGTRLSDDIVAGPEGVLVPRWTPDGRHLLVAVVKPADHPWNLARAQRQLWIVRDASRQGRKATLIERLGPSRILQFWTTPGSHWVQVRVTNAFRPSKVSAGGGSSPSEKLLSSYLWNIQTGTRLAVPFADLPRWATDDRMFVAMDHQTVRLWRVYGDRVIRGDVLIHSADHMPNVAWQPVKR